MKLAAIPIIAAILLALSATALPAEEHGTEWKNDMILFKKARPYMPEGIYTKLFILERKKPEQYAMLVSVLPIAEIGYYYEIYNELRRCDHVLFEGRREKEEFGAPIAELVRAQKVYTGGLLSLFEAIDVTLPADIGKRFQLWDEHSFFQGIAMRNHRWIELDAGWRIKNARDHWKQFRENVRTHTESVPVNDRIAVSSATLGLLQKTAEGDRKDLAAWLKFIAENKQAAPMLHPLRSWYANNKMNSVFDEVFDNISTLNPQSLTCVIVDWRNAPTAMELLKTRKFKKIMFEKEIRAITIK